MSEIIITISKIDIQKFIESAVEKAILHRSKEATIQSDSFLDVDHLITFFF